MSGKTVVILQSSYIPWKGYFDLIQRADEFILYDDVQYTKNDWRNRNLIKTPRGVQWLTIPVRITGRFGQKINETRCQGSAWRSKHWKTIRQNYKKAAHFKNYETEFESLYLTDHEDLLSRINHTFIAAVCRKLGISTKISSVADYPVTSGKTQRLVALCLAAGATRYLSGPSAKIYIEPDLFRAAGLQLDYMDYEGYPPYRQCFGAFEHRVSILDLLFNEGPEAGRFLKRAR